jgi:hypothetical protein
VLEGARQGPVLVSTNVTFRGEVFGPRVKVERSQAFLDLLCSMTVIMTEIELGRAKRIVLMEHPINAAMWLSQALKKDGVALKVIRLSRCTSSEEREQGMVNIVTCCGHLTTRCKGRAAGGAPLSAVVMPADSLKTSILRTSTGRLPRLAATTAGTPGE